MPGIVEEAHNEAVWKSMKPRLPRYGVGTVVESCWAFADQVPTISAAIKSHGGIYKAEAYTFKFGSDPRFVHRIKYSRR